MTILSELKTLLSTLNVPIETGAFKSEAPDTYIVLVPLSEIFPLHADDFPAETVEECRITIFSKTNYQNLKKQIVSLCLSNFMYIDDRKFNGYDSGSGYYQFTIDVAKNYLMEENS